MPRAPDILRSKRMAAGITQEQLGKSLGVPKQTISRWELGHTKVSFELVVKWASILDVSLDQLSTEQE